MSKLSIASQLAAIQRQKVLLAKKEDALKAESRGKVLTQIIKLAKDAGLSLAEISSAYEGHRTKLPFKATEKISKNNPVKPHTTKGIKLPPKYINLSDSKQTWTGRGVDPSWFAKLREAGLLETALVQSN